MPGESGLHQVAERRSILPLFVLASMEPDITARVAQTMRNRARLHSVPDFERLSEFVFSTTEPIDVAILPPRDLHGSDATPLVHRLTRDRPGTAIVILCRAGSEHSPSIRKLAAAGAHQFLFRGIDDYGVVLRAVLDAARQQCAAEVVLRSLMPVVPATLHPIVEAVLAAPDRVTDIGSLANALSIHRKTLFNRCARADFLLPGELLRWTRLALVGYLLSTTGCTLERIALDLGFSTDVALRNLLKRYTGMPSSEIRRADGCATIIRALQRRLQRKAREGPSSNLHLV